jgi:hypothetical protein
MPPLGFMSGFEVLGNWNEMANERMQELFTDQPYGKFSPPSSLAATSTAFSLVSLDSIPLFCPVIWSIKLSFPFTAPYFL